MASELDDERVAFEALKQDVIVMIQAKFPDLDFSVKKTGTGKLVVEAPYPSGRNFKNMNVGVRPDFRYILYSHLFSRQGEKDRQFKALMKDLDQTVNGVWVRSLTAGTDWNQFVISTPADCGEYYSLDIPIGVEPPAEGDVFVLSGQNVVVQTVSTPADIAAGKGGPVAQSMRKTGIAYRVNCLPEGHEWLRPIVASENDVKSQILERAGKIKSAKAKKYVHEGLMKKIDQMGEAAGIWLEKLESGFGNLKPKGMMEGFEDADFDDLWFVLTGEKKRKGADVLLFPGAGNGNDSSDSTHHFRLGGDMKCKVMFPPEPFDFKQPTEPPVAFLGGAIDMGKAEDWQAKLTKVVEDVPCVLLNPRRKDWDSSWKQSIDNPDFKQQVEWELKGLEQAHLIVIVLTADSKAPISLLEFGLHAGEGKVMVFCPEGYYRKGNVDVVAARYGVPVYGDWDEFAEAFKSRMAAPFVGRAKAASAADRVEKRMIAEKFVMAMHTASSVRPCTFYKAVDGKWYMELAENSRVDSEVEEDDYFDEDIYTYGPFETFELAHRYLQRHFSNPGGFHEDASGRRPVPTRSPNGRPVERVASDRTAIEGQRLREIFYSFGNFRHTAEKEHPALFVQLGYRSPEEAWGDNPVVVSTSRGWKRMHASDRVASKVSEDSICAVDMEAAAKIGGQFFSALQMGVLKDIVRHGNGHVLVLNAPRVYGGKRDMKNVEVAYVGAFGSDLDSTIEVPTSILRVIGRAAADESDVMAGEKMSRLYTNFHTHATKLGTSRPPASPVAVQILESMNKVDEALKGKMGLTGRAAVRAFLHAIRPYFNEGFTPIASLIRRYGRDAIEDIIWERRAGMGDMHTFGSPLRRRRDYGERDGDADLAGHGSNAEEQMVVPEVMTSSENMRVRIISDRIASEAKEFMG